MLGKRARPPMKRTTSMAEFAADLDVSEEQKSHHQHQNQHPREKQRAWAPHSPPQMVEGGGTAAIIPRKEVVASMDGLDSMYMTPMVSPRNTQRRNSMDSSLVATAHFLRYCGLCHRSLAPGKDIYMYRGEIAFCSLKCRQQQIKLDERKEKCSLASMKKDTPPVTAGSEPNGETVAAA